LTRGAEKAILKADLVIVDYLVSPEIIDIIPKSTRILIKKK